VQPVSERLFEQFCQANGIPCSPVGTGPGSTPDYLISLGGIRVTCEVKQINPNTEDLKELAALSQHGATARYISKRLRAKLKKISPQLKDASSAGCPRCWWCTTIRRSRAIQIIRMSCKLCLGDTA
jgi:hypothetical protein